MGNILESNLPLDVAYWALFAFLMFPINHNSHEKLKVCQIWKWRTWICKIEYEFFFYNNTYRCTKVGFDPILITYKSSVYLIFINYINVYLSCLAGIFFSLL